MSRRVEYDFIDYRREPEPPCAPDDAAWADQLQREKGTALAENRLDRLANGNVMRAAEMIFDASFGVDAESAVDRGGDVFRRYGPALGIGGVGVASAPEA